MLYTTIPVGAVPPSVSCVKCGWGNKAHNYTEWEDSPCECITRFLFTWHGYIYAQTYRNMNRCVTFLPVSLWIRLIIMEKHDTTCASPEHYTMCLFVYSKIVMWEVKNWLKRVGQRVLLKEYVAGGHSRYIQSWANWVEGWSFVRIGVHGLEGSLRYGRDISRYDIKVPIPPISFGLIIVSPV